MSDTYIGWDGKSYPWPPPDGWYHASDGRWWAPNTGPNPPPMAAPPRFEQTAQLDHTSEYAEHGRHSDEAAYAEHATGYPEQPAHRQHAAIGGDEHLAPATARAGRATASATPSYFDDPGHLPPPGPASQLPPPGPSGAPLGFDPDRPDEGGGDPYGYGVPPTPTGGDGLGGLGPKKLVIGVAAVLAVVAIAVSAILLQGGDDNIEANGTTTTAPGATTAPVATLPPANTGTAAPADPNATPTTAGPADPGASSTLAPADAAQVASFRALLVQNGLTSDKLTDTDIQRFAASFCAFAKSSKSSEEFNVFREQAIADTESNLDPASLTKVIDAAVITFCPDEAARLGITLG